ncbi:MAG: nucleoside phosphorylase [Solirubrobacteraceae bacterium]|jgi:uridine phosphorylase|nr:nucleoside phosphorylase [Solirubrobacteraceae bacterium]
MDSSPSGAADARAPIQQPKDTTAASVFRPEGLVREGRRQLGRTGDDVPAVCLLDPDGDVVRHLIRTELARLHPGWACYHTELWTAEHAGVPFGVVGCAVGAPFAVLVAEQLAVSGCELVVSVTSSGQLIEQDEPPYHVLIERAWRDEGTSAHYLPPEPWSRLPARLRRALEGTVGGLGEPVHAGASWTTDAPFRETEAAIDAARAAGCHVVEMEAAALYAYAEARERDVVCLAHVTNTMAVDGDDFEKGPHAGALATLEVFAAVARALGHGARAPGAAVAGGAGA